MEYKVTQLQREDIEALPKSKVGGNNEDFVDWLLGNFAANASHAYLVEWTGNTRVPRGASLDNHVVGWTQHGLVGSTEGEMIGVYERFKDLDGPNKDENSMLIMLHDRKV